MLLLTLLRLLRSCSFSKLVFRRLADGRSCHGRASFRFRFLRFSESMCTVSAMHSGAKQVGENAIACVHFRRDGYFGRSGTWSLKQGIVPDVESFTNIGVEISRFGRGKSDDVISPVLVP